MKIWNKILLTLGIISCSAALIMIPLYAPTVNHWVYISLIAVIAILALISILPFLLKMFVKMFDFSYNKQDGFKIEEKEDAEKESEILN